MPNILLKNEVGEDIAYNDVDTVTLRRVEGGTATYTFQRPNATDEWWKIQNFINGDARTNLFTKYQVSVPSGRIVSSTEQIFGTWYQSRYDAWRISNTMFNQMYAVPDGAILANNNSNAALYLWDDTDKELKVLSSNAGNITNFRAYGDKYFIATYRYWLLYDPETKQVTQLLQGVSMNAYCLDTGEELLLSVANSGSNNPQGIYRLDPETYALTQIFNEGWYWLGTFRTTTGLYQSAAYVLELEDEYLFGGYTSTTGCYGVLRFDKETKTVTRLTNIGYYFFTDALTARYAYSTFNRIIPGYGVVFCSNQSPSWGVWFYDTETKQVTRLIETAYMTNWVEEDDIVYGCYSGYGVLIFDKATKTWYRPLTSGQYEKIVKCENGFLIGCQSYSYGIKYYDIATGEITTITTNMNYWRYGVSVEGGALMSCDGTSNSGVWFFDETEKTFTQLTTQGYGWRMVKWHDSVLMGSFNNSTYGWLFYKDGELTYNAGYDGNQRGMRCIVPVEDGWIISAWSYNVKIVFVDGETGESTSLGTNGSQLGPYMQSWYGHGGIWKPSWDFDRKYGRYRIISSYDGYGIIFDDITHEAVPMMTWSDSSVTPTPTSTSKSVYMRRVSFIEYAPNVVLVVQGSSSNSGTVLLNYATGEAYLFNNASLYANNDYSYWFLPFSTLVPVSDGYLLFVKPFDWSEYQSTFTSAAGVWHIDTSTNRLKRIYTQGYYDTVEEAPGGLYIYLSSMPEINRLYWNSDSKTITKVQY